MKKIIGMMVILFFTTGIFGQKFIRNLSFIEPKPNKIEMSVINQFLNFGEIDYVHFVKNDRLFLLAFEPNERYMYGVDRDVYLYSKDIKNIDSPWEIASDVVARCNWIDLNNFSDIDFFTYNKDRHNTSMGKVVVVDSCVKITIEFDVITNGNVSISEPITYIFTPIGDNFYNCNNAIRSSL